MEDTVDRLFEKRAIGAKTAPNLLVLHPLERGDGDAEGKPHETAYEWYRQLAAGQWGILFVECVACSDDPADRGHHPNGLLMCESNLPEFKRMVREIKEVSPETVLMIQLSTGSVGEGSYLGDLPSTGWKGNEDFMNLPASVIQRSLENMIKGSVVAAEAGFDGMDFKLCHGHMTYQLLCRANKRQDEWGGETLRERARFTVEVVEGIRTELALRKKEDFIIGARISEPNMANLRDIVEVLDGDLGMDFISVSNPDVFNADAISIMTQFVKMMKPKAAVMQAAFTSYLATQVNPVEQMRQALASALPPDFVGFGRQAIADPLTPEKLRKGLFEDINWCKRCLGCFRSPHCVHYGPKDP